MTLISVVLNRIAPFYCCVLAGDARL